MPWSGFGVWVLGRGLGDKEIGRVWFIVWGRKKHLLEEEKERRFVGR